MSLHELLKGYQVECLRKASREFSISGKRVLDIGSEPPFNFLQILKTKFNAREVFGINIRDDYNYGTVMSGVNVIRTSSSKMIEFDNDSIDLVFGLAVFEHIADVKASYQEIARILSPGGRAYILIGRIWTSSKGHHLWTHIENEFYCYKGNNPIADWSHLYLNKDEMRSELSKKVPSRHVEHLVYKIYTSNEINRIGLKEHINLVEHHAHLFSSIKIEKRKKHRRNPPAIVLDKIHNAGKSLDEDYAKSEILVTLEG